jgi:hypothetical protein
VVTATKRDTPEKEIMELNQKLAAERIRARLERRLANFLDCEVEELPRIKLGELIHLAFALWGEEETLGGFHATFSAVSRLVSRELLWDLEEPKEEPKAVIN